MKAEGLIEKPFVPKRRSFTFPPVEKMGANVVEIKVGVDIGIASGACKHAIEAINNLRSNVFLLRFGWCVWKGRRENVIMW